ncbi:hypothetical protein E1B28_003770 [Marasmius oreades]|uniref:Uncharacterized protein n=1 Tax=Marasmius oreades TaxID=181124 RepID=A0A9P8AAT3_9AGAR|nr:uncharacterized protein E1B28_003770 [Marasmius oreades]KAG7096326.1 hypothetical protein E1B28_003770 [Marasmius oreades]
MLPIVTPPSPPPPTPPPIIMTSLSTVRIPVGTGSFLDSTVTVSFTAGLAGTSPGTSSQITSGSDATITSKSSTGTSTTMHILSSDFPGNARNLSSGEKTNHNIGLIVGLTLGISTLVAFSVIFTARVLYLRHQRRMEMEKSTWVKNPMVIGEALSSPSIIEQNVRRGSGKRRETTESVVHNHNVVPRTQREEQPGVTRMGAEDLPPDYHE